MHHSSNQMWRRCKFGIDQTREGAFEPRQRRPVIVLYSPLTINCASIYSSAITFGFCLASILLCSSLSKTLFVPPADPPLIHPDSGKVNKDYFLYPDASDYLLFPNLDVSGLADPMPHKSQCHLLLLFPRDVCEHHVDIPRPVRPKCNPS